MATNDFLPVAVGGTPNVQSQVDYAGSSEQVQGYATGEVPTSMSWNKMLRQSSSIASMLAAWICKATGQDMLDNGDIDGKVLLMALASASGGGQCLISVTDATHLKLSPYNGRLINIAGQMRSIPGAGITITNATLGNSTLYYVYAYMNVDVMALELSATGHSTDATTGVETKTGDTSRSLLGMIRTTGTGQFADSATQRFCANWFNRVQKVATNFGSFTGTSVATIDLLAANHAEFLTWADEEVNISIIASFQSATVNKQVDTGPATDGVVNAQIINLYVAVANENFNTSLGDVPFGNMAEGYHYATVAGSTESGIVVSWSTLRVVTPLYI